MLVQASDFGSGGGDIVLRSGPMPSRCEDVASRRWKRQQEVNAAAAAAREAVEQDVRATRDPVEQAWILVRERRTMSVIKKIWKSQEVRGISFDRLRHGITFLLNRKRNIMHRAFLKELRSAKSMGHVQNRKGIEGFEMQVGAS